MVYEPLLRAVASGASLDEVQGLLNEAPEEESRGTALFEVIERALRRRKAGSDVLQLLIQQDPSCVHEVPSHGGDSLLHTACLCRAPLDIINLLLELNPGAIRIVDDDGDLPLHCFCYDDDEVELSMDVLELIVSKFPNAVRMTNQDGMIPLHVACQDKARAEIVQFLLSCYPEGLCKGDCDNMLPIHYACTGKNPSTDVANVLLNKYPEGATIKETEYGFLPLHIACENQNWEVARVLLQVYPGGSRTFDDPGLLPIHLACFEAAPLDIVRMLIDAYPESVHVRISFSGALALHEACSGSAPRGVLQLLLERYPDAIRVADSQGMLPLHCACWHCCDLNHIRFLVRHSDPLTLLRKTHKEQTPLELAYDNRHATDEMKRFLLEKQREVVQLHRDAVDVVVGTCLNAVDNNDNFPDLVFARIWEFAQPDVWYPPEDDE